MSSPPPFRCRKKKCGLYFATIGDLCVHFTEAHSHKPKPRKFKLDDDLPKPTAEQRKQIREFIKDGKQWQGKRKGLL